MEGTHGKILDQIIPMNLFMFLERGQLQLGGTNHFFRSKDGGQTWDSIANPTPSGIWSILETDLNSILVGLRNADAVLRSDDEGLSFSLVLGDPGFSPAVWNFLTTDFSGKIYATQDFRSEIYMSSDNGDSWDTLSMPKQSGAYTSMNGRVFFITQNSVILKVNDEGTELLDHAIVDPSLNVYGAQVCVRKDEAIFVSNFKDIFLSFDNGLTWKLENSGFDTTGVFVDDIRIMGIEVDSKGFVYVYGPGGLFKSRTGNNGISIKNSKIFMLDGGTSLEIFPNPFKNKSKISFNLSKKGLIKIMGIDGKTLRHYNVSNKTKIFWDGKNVKGDFLPSGIFLIEADLDGKIYRNRIILAR